jgi:predicted RNase H-like HicB family nuclease
MNESARYVKIVEWSDEDQCFVGQCPGIVGPCCHGTDEAQVYAELCEIVNEWIEILKKGGNPLPPPTAGKDVAKKLLDAA